MMAINPTLQLTWLPIALDALLLLTMAAIGLQIWIDSRHARRTPIGVRPFSTVSAIVVGSPSAPAAVGQVPSVTSLPEAA